MIYVQNIIHFPQFSDKFLTEQFGGKKRIFYDIETTGLSREHCQVYLIGAVYKENEEWFYSQWFDDTGNEEMNLLKTFSEFICQFDTTVQYNGDSFDEPFLKVRYESHKLSCPFENKKSSDLYKIFKPLKGILKLNSMKQPDLEDFLSVSSRKYCDGKNCIKLYKKYITSKNEDIKDDLLKEVLGHNYEDLMGLLSILSLNTYLRLFQGDFKLDDCMIDKDSVIFRLKMPFSFPTEISNGISDYYMTARKDEVLILCTLHDHKIRQYYKNYKDYHFIPSEDYAIPKSLSFYLDPSLKKAATAKTCYTWFPCNEKFLNNKEQQISFIKKVLDFMLCNIK